MTLDHPWLASLTVMGAGLAAAGWRQLRLLLQKAVSLLVVRAELAESAGEVLFRHVGRTFARTPGPVRRYGDHWARRRCDGYRTHVAYEALAPGTVFWRGGRPLWFARRPNGNGYTVAFFRSTFRLASLMREADEAAIAVQRQGIAAATARGLRRVGNGRTPGLYSRFCVMHHGATLAGGDAYDRAAYRGADPSTTGPAAVASAGPTPCDVGVSPLLGYAWDELGDVEDRPALADLALPPEARDALAAVDAWFADADWYHERGIAHRMGLLLHGGPGNGKTLFAVALARDFGVPLHVLDLASMSNACLRAAVAAIRRDTPAIALVEDIHAVFRGTRNVAEVGVNRAKLTFDAVLDALGGAEAAEGVLWVVTTNDVGAIDEALGRPLRDDPTRTTRPMRLDVAAHFTAPDLAGRRQLAARVFPDAPAEAEALAVAGAGDSGAQFLDRCRRRALELREAALRPACVVAARAAG